MPSTDERARELRRHLPDSAVAAILGVDLEEIAELRLDPEDSIEGAPDDAESGGGAEPDPQAGQVVHFLGDWSSGRSYVGDSFGLNAVLGSDLKMYLAIGNTDEDTNPADIAAAGFAGNWIPFAPLGGGFDFQGAWSAGDYPAGAVVTHGGITYYAAADTSDEPGISGAPDADGNPTVWVEEGAHSFDATAGPTPDGTPFDNWPSTILYVPVTHAGHLGVAFSGNDGMYVNYLLIKGSDMSLQASGSSDNAIGADLDSTGDWFFQMFHDDGFDSGHEPGPYTATITFTSGLTVTPAPEENAWQAFATAP